MLSVRVSRGMSTMVGMVVDEADELILKPDVINERVQVALSRAVVTAMLRHWAP